MFRLRNKKINYTLLSRGLSAVSELLPVITITKGPAHVILVPIESASSEGSDEPAHTCSLAKP